MVPVHPTPGMAFPPAFTQVQPIKANPEANLNSQISVEKALQVKGTAGSSVPASREHSDLIKKHTWLVCAFPLLVCAGTTPGFSWLWRQTRDPGRAASQSLRERVAANRPRCKQAGKGTGCEPGVPGSAPAVHSPSQDRCVALGLSVQVMILNALG